MMRVMEIIMDLIELKKLFNDAVVIPLSNIPAQRFQCILNNQNCTIVIKYRSGYCYFSLIANGKTVIKNVICLCGNNLVPYRTSKFIGSLFFIDMNKHYSIPRYEEFNQRYRLMYIPFRMEEYIDI